MQTQTPHNYDSNNIKLHITMHIKPLKYINNREITELITRGQARNVWKNCFYFLKEISKYSNTVIDMQEFSTTTSVAILHPMRVLSEGFHREIICFFKLTTACTNFSALF